MQVKMQFLKKNNTFTCITDPCDPSWVSVMQVKVMIENGKPHFYLHNRYLAMILCR